VHGVRHTGDIDLARGRAIEWKLPDGVVVDSSSGSLLVSAPCRVHQEHLAVGISERTVTATVVVVE
jgi:hypothetical protein